jgi:hypothetical protein
MHCCCDRISRIRENKRLAARCPEISDISQNPIALGKIMDKPYCMVYIGRIVGKNCVDLLAAHFIRE